MDAKNFILSIIVIAVLFIPVATGYTAERTKLEVIMTTPDASFNFDGYLNSDTINLTVIDAVNSKLFNLEEPNNDTFIEASGMNKPTLTNDITTIADVNYAIINWTPLVNPFTVYHQLDATAEDILDTDFIRIQTDANQGNIYLAWYDDVGGFNAIWFNVNLGNNTYMNVLDFVEIQSLKNAGENDLFLAFGNPNELQTNYSFQISTYQIGTDIIAYDETSIFVISMLVSVAILIPTLIFSSDWIDLKKIKNAKGK